MISLRLGGSWGDPFPDFHYFTVDFYLSDSDVGVAFDGLLDVFP